MAKNILSPSLKVVETFFQQAIPAGSNPGLVFDRYLPIWKDGKRVGEVFAPLLEFANRFKELNGDYQPLLDRLHDRQELIVEKADRDGKAGLKLKCSVCWRLVSGMGNDHPLENGFTMDYLSGVPFIRATALKGLCRRATDLSDQDDGWDEKTNIRIFGSRDPMASGPSERKERGDIVFLDAYPLQWPTLEVDIMNTHHQGYYRKYDKKALRETENPVPVFFLTVAAGTEFVFRLFSRSGNAGNVGKVKKALLDGLKFLGVGAKTGVGYGRFSQHQSQKGRDWLDKSLKELSVEHHEPNENNILRGKALAACWQAITDPELKQEVLVAIKKRWDDLKLFESGGRALRQVKQIYWGE